MIFYCENYCWKKSSLIVKFKEYYLRDAYKKLFQIKKYFTFYLLSYERNLDIALKKYCDFDNFLIKYLGRENYF